MTTNLYDQQLRTTYGHLKQQAISFAVEPFDVIESVHKYRMYWKPKQVKTLLLAESHVATLSDDHARKHRFDLTDYPENFVRFVYCLSYGDNSSLSNPVLTGKSGTPQFWKLFSETVSKKFRVNNNPDKLDKRTQKIALLEEMKRCGIWLLDCSIAGVYVPAGQKPATNEYTKILTTSFDDYCKPIIDAEKPDEIIVIGKQVYDLLTKNPAHQDWSYKDKIDWIHQPNAIVKNENRRTLESINYKLHG